MDWRDVWKLRESLKIPQQVNAAGGKAIGVVDNSILPNFISGNEFFDANSEEQARRMSLENRFYNIFSSVINETTTFPSELVKERAVHYTNLRRAAKGGRKAVHRRHRGKPKGRTVYEINRARAPEIAEASIELLNLARKSKRTLAKTVKTHSAESFFGESRRYLHNIYRAINKVSSRPGILEKPYEVIRKEHTAIAHRFNDQHIFAKCFVLSYEREVYFFTRDWDFIKIARECQQEKTWLSSKFRFPLPQFGFAIIYKNRQREFSIFQWTNGSEQETPIYFEQNGNRARMINQYTPSIA